MTEGEGEREGEKETERQTDREGEKKTDSQKENTHGKAERPVQRHYRCPSNFHFPETFPELCLNQQHAIHEHFKLRPIN